MSVEPLQCQACGVERIFERAGKFPEGWELAEVSYGVTWRCPQCQKRTLELCPIGPVEPEPSSCLNCGGQRLQDEECGECGMGRAEAIAYLGVGTHAPRSVEAAAAAFERGLHRHAFARLNLLLQEDPKAVKAWELKAQYYQILRLNRAAARCYRRALLLQGNPFWEIALACALSDLEQHEEAIQIYGALLAKTSDAQALAIAHANRANSHKALGNEAAAIADYEEAIRREPWRVTTYLNYERLFARDRRWLGAAEVLARGFAAVAAAEALPLWLEQARIFNEQEQAEQGLAAADEALALAPDHPRALYQRGWALGMLGRLKDARASLSRLLELDPQDSDALRGLQSIDAALSPAAQPSIARAKPWWKVWRRA